MRNQPVGDYTITTKSRVISPGDPGYEEYREGIQESVKDLNQHIQNLDKQVDIFREIRNEGRPKKKKRPTATRPEPKPSKPKEPEIRDLLDLGKNESP